jgi:hypothetical protein
MDLVFRSGAKWTPLEDAVLRGCTRIKEAQDLLPHRTIESLKSRATVVRRDATEKRRTSPETWAKVAKLLREGSSLQAVAALKGCPDRSTIYLRLKADTEFAAQANWSKASDDGFDQAAADRLLAYLRDGNRISDRVRPEGLPSEKQIWVWRRRRPDFDEALKAAQVTPSNWRFSEHEVRNLIEVMQSGGRPEDVVPSSTLSNWRRNHPDFARLFARLAGDRRKRRKVKRPVACRSVSGPELVASIEAAVPRTLPADVRADIVGAMLLEGAERRLKPSDVPHRVGEFITAHYRQFSKFGPRSLDEPICDGSKTALIDTIENGLWSEPKEMDHD